MTGLPMYTVSLPTSLFASTTAEQKSCQDVAVPLEYSNLASSMQPDQCRAECYGHSLCPLAMQSISLHLQQNAGNNGRSAPPGKQKPVGRSYPTLSVIKTCR